MGVRFSFELQDNFIGQYCVMFFPHTVKDEFLPRAENVVLEHTKFFVGALQYLMGLKWRVNSDQQEVLVSGCRGSVYCPDAFPVVLPRDGPLSELHEIYSAFC